MQKTLARIKIDTIYSQSFLVKMNDTFQIVTLWVYVALILQINTFVKIVCKNNHIYEPSKRTSLTIGGRACLERFNSCTGSQIFFSKCHQRHWDTFENTHQEKRPPPVPDFSCSISLRLCSFMGSGLRAVRRDFLQNPRPQIRRISSVRQDVMDELWFAHSF